MIKGKKVYFRPEVINALYRLDDNVIGHAIFKNSTQQDMQDALARVSWPGTKWDRTPTGKYQLFPHNLNTAANVRLLFCQEEKDHAYVPQQHHFHGQSHVPLLQYRGDSDEYGWDNMWAYPRMGQASSQHETLPELDWTALYKGMSSIRETPSDRGEGLNMYCAMSSPRD